MSPPVRKGDGTGLKPQNVAEVRTGDGRVLFGGDIPDSFSNEWRGSETGVSDGQTVNTWDDAVGSLSLDGTGGPELNTGSLNGNDAVEFFGTDEAYTLDVASDITEPFTMLFALEIETLDEFDILWRQDGGNEQIRFDLSSINWSFGGSTDSGGSPTTGDHIITVAVDDQTADLRQDGTQIASVQSASGDVVIDSTNTPSFFADVNGSRRYMDCLTGIIAFHQDTKLSGQALDDEEKRLEDKLDMNVL